MKYKIWLFFFFIFIAFAVSAKQIVVCQSCEVKTIKEAIKMAKKGDAVIITGKGSEPFMRLEKGKKIPWSEREIIEGILNELKIEI